MGANPIYFDVEIIDLVLFSKSLGLHLLLLSGVNYIF